MTKSTTPPPPRRRSTRYQRLQRQKAYKRPSLIARLRGLQGRARFAVFGVALVVVLGIISATGGTAYALNQENQDSFCASCHTQPETQYYQQSVAAAPSTLASFHATKNVRCIDCHSGGGAFGRMEGLAQGGQDLLSYYSGHYHNPAITTSKLSDDSCTKCHAEVYYAAGFNNHFHRFLTQWQSADPNAAGCVDCHTAHPTAGADQQFMAESTFTPVCQRCHSVLGGGE